MWKPTVIALCSLSVCAPSAGAAEIPKFLPENVTVTDENELVFVWQGQGTLICNGIASNSRMRVPEDLPYGPANECWVDFPSGRSNTLTLECKRSMCVVSGAGRKSELRLAASSAESPSAQPDATENSPIFQPIAGQAPSALSDTAVEAAGDEPPAEIIVERYPTQSDPFDAPADAFVVQVIALSDAARLDNYAADIPGEQFKKATIESNGQILFALVAGPYNTYEEALAAKDSIPSRDSNQQPPWIRSVGSLKQAVQRGTQLLND